MAKAAPFNSLSKIAGAAILVLMAAGCAREAAELPPEGVSSGAAAAITLTPAETRMTCAGVAQERAAIAKEERGLEAKIKANRDGNQAAVFIAGAAGAALAEHNQAEKARLDELQKKRDRLNVIARQKSC
jgi:hypothetical protein